MIFWDTSALVPLLVDEPASGSLHALAKADPTLLVWWASSVECRSAIARREREGAFSGSDADAARAVLHELELSWVEIQPSEELRDRAHRLLLRHPLRAADALQLAAALTWARDRPHEHPVAILDERLGRAARAEGFRVVAL